MARHKGKVERAVQDVRRQILAGRDFADIEEANRRALIWCVEDYGCREHGTTKRQPIELYETYEKAALSPLPDSPFEAPVWKEAKVHPDLHIVFDGSYYSVPYRYVGHRVWVRATLRTVRIYLDEKLIKTHTTAPRPGTWRTDENDYPPDKAQFLTNTPEVCRDRAKAMGPNVFEMIDQLLKAHALKNLRKAQGILRLADRFGPDRLDAACARALRFGNTRYQSIKTILDQGLDRVSEPEKNRAPSVPKESLRFLRPANYFSH
jgi:hypothetical protein